MGAIRKTDYKSAITSRPLRGACLKPPDLLVFADLRGRQATGSETRIFG
jgi:hypothetical protein